MCDVLLQTLFFSFMVIQFCYFLVVKNKFFFLHNLHKHNISKTVILLKRNIKSLVLICFDWANRRYYTFWRISNCLPCFFFFKKLSEKQANASTVPMSSYQIYYCTVIEKTYLFLSVQRAKEVLVPTSPSCLFPPPFCPFR